MATLQRSIFRTTRRLNAEGRVSLSKRRRWFTTNVDQFDSAGLERIYWGRIDVNGYLNGLTGALANGSDDGMARLPGVQSFNLNLQQPRQVNTEGNNGVLSVYFFEANTLPNGDLVLGAVDLNFIAKAQNTKTYADGDWNVPILQPDSPDYQRLCLITLADAKSQQSGSVGNGGFMGKIYPNVQVVPLGDAGLSNAGGTTFTHAMIASKFDRLPWGTLLSESNNGTERGVVYGPFFSEYRFTMHTLIGDGTATTVTLDYTPAAANGNKVKAWQDGVALVYGAGAGKYTVSGSVVTFGTAPTAGAKVEIRYEHI